MDQRFLARSAAGQALGSRTLAGTRRRLAVGAWFLGGAAPDTFGGRCCVGKHIVAERMNVFWLFR